MNVPCFATGRGKSGPGSRKPPSVASQIHPGFLTVLGCLLSLHCISDLGTALENPDLLLDTSSSRPGYAGADCCTV